MGILLQGFFKLQKGRALPSPADGNAADPWWWDHLAAQARKFSLAGFSAVWLPPVLKTASGAGPTADGYGPFDDYDIGSRNQKGSLPTRYGTREQLQRCVAILRANGLDVYLDMVEHQRIGDTTPFVFRYPGADGTLNIGRFPKNPPNFVPQVPHDPNLGGPIADDSPFGRELAPINGQPARYVFDNLIAAGDWLTRALDVQGYRVDDVKGLSTDFLRPFLNSAAMKDKFAVGEFFDGNIALLSQWIFNPTGMNGRSSAFDFPLKFKLNGMCNNPGRFNMADLDHAGLAGASPFNAVTFVENHDTDLNDGQRIVSNKMMGYAYILTSEGYPSVFYKDYSADAGCYGLQPQIDNLIWIHEVLASGATLQRWKDFNVFAYERLGGPHLLVALNNDPAGPRTIRVETGFGANVGLHDYTGHAGDTATDAAGVATLTIPANKDGLGYVCYSRQGQDRALDLSSHNVTQDFEGDADLDIPPCENGKTLQIGKIWCAAGSSVDATLVLDRNGWDANTRVTFDILGADAPTPTGSMTLVQGNAAPTHFQATAHTEGSYTLRVTATGLPSGTSAYKLSARYQAPQTFVPGPPPVAGPKTAGQWSKPFALDNVAIHAHLLPTGKVLYWGRRKEFGSEIFATLNDHATQTYILDPDTLLSRATANQPVLKDGNPVNLFCSGHSFLPDGKLMVAGGHLFDSQGVNQSCIYDSTTDRWTAAAEMNKGRWYPSLVTLPDGGALVLSGSFPIGALQPPTNGSTTNPTPQVWHGVGWQSLADFPSKELQDGLQLFPRFHIEPKHGHVFLSGPQKQSYFFDTSGIGSWTHGPQRQGNSRDYAPSIMFDGKVLFVGGGHDDGTNLPSDLAELIDLAADAPVWQPTSPMHFRRRQHNATILADGTILVTGGTQGPGFNDLAIGLPIRAAELWDPATANWTVLAEEAVDRCYHATALLLPDGRVLSAGGGEYAPELNVVNPPADTHSDAQLFSPPYLFRGPRPSFTGAPDVTFYGQTFRLQVEQADEIAKVTWIRIGSVTHSFDQNQRLNTLAFTRTQDGIEVTTPANANLSPPGHYMLFLINHDGVPSIGHIAHIAAPATAAFAVSASEAVTFNAPRPSPQDIDAETTRAAERPPVIVGITPTCPYGLAGCWGGAKGALLRLTDVKTVLEVADAFTSTATVFLVDDRLPDIDLWRREFANTINGSYSIRGLEVTLVGQAEIKSGVVWLSGNPDRPAVRLMPLLPLSKVQWDPKTKAPFPPEPQEVTAAARLAHAITETQAATVSVTGPLLKDQQGFYVEVREFALRP